MSSQNFITENQIRTSLNNSIIAGAIGVFFFTIIQNGPIPLMLEMLGASGIAIGMTTMLFQLGMLTQIPSALFAERLATRKPFWASTAMIARGAMLIPGIYLLAKPGQTAPVIWITLTCIGFFSFLAQCGGPVWLGWMADLVPEDKRAGFWARRQGVSMIGCVISVALTGWFLDLFPDSSMAGFGWLLIFASVMGMLDLVVHWFVVEPEPGPTNFNLSPARRIFQPLENRDFLYFTLAMCVWFFGLGFFAPFMNVYLKSAFDVTYTHLSAIQLSGMISSVVSCFVGGYLINRTGLRSFGLAMVITIPLFSIAWFFLDGHATGLLPILGPVPQPVMILCMSSLIAGGVYAAVAMLQLNLVSALSSAEGRTMFMAVHWTLVGFLSALGPIAGGWVKDYFTAHPIPIILYGGTAFSYFHLLILLHGVMIWFVMLPLLLKIQKKEGEWPVQRAVADIFILTPLRSVRNIYSYNLAAVNYGKAIVIKEKKRRGNKK
jgi:MFS family permease